MGNPKEDLLALAFMVGGEINTIKSTADGRGRFVAEGLPNPRDLVLNVAKHDISHAVEQSRQEAFAKQQQQQQQQNPNGNITPQIQSSSNGNDQLSNEILKELKIINDYLRRFAARAGV